MENYNNNHFESKKYKLYKNKKWLAILLTTSTILVGGNIYHTRKNFQKINSTKDYKVGYDDIGLLTNKITNKVTEDNFVLLDIGDRNTDGTYFLNQKLNWCMKNGIAVGLIVSSDAKELVDIYLDLEFVKEILTKYNIEYPVYLNVDSIFENEDLTFERANTLIESFLKKAEENHIYVGVYGKNENILDQYSNYTKLVTDKPTNSDIFQNKNIYYANLELQNVIVNGSYQNPNCFVSDEYHIVEENETLKDIARNYQLSVTDLKKYNNISKSIEEGDYLTIPSFTYQESRHFNHQATKIGIDVSKWQDQINWQEVEVDYAIIQIRDFYNQENDPMFLNNVKGCLNNNIPMGFYAFSRATTIEEVKTEAKYIIEQIKNYPVEYPIYLDLETELWHSIDEEGKFTVGNYTAEETKLFVMEFIKTWQQEILKEGYTPGIYCNSGLYEKLNIVTDNYLQNLSCWVAGGELYDQEINYNPNDALPNIDQESNVAMKQISQKGKVAGINGYADINYCYLDYEKDTLSQPEHSFTRLNHELEFGSKFILIGGAMFLLRKKKIKKRSKKM